MTVLLILASSILTPIFLKVLYGKDKKLTAAVSTDGADAPVSVDVEAMVDEIPAVKNLGMVKGEPKDGNEENK